MSGSTPMMICHGALVQVLLPPVLAGDVEGERAGPVHRRRARGREPDGDDLAGIGPGVQLLWNGPRS